MWPAVFGIQIERKKLNQIKATAFFSLTWTEVTHGFTPSFTPCHKMMREHSREGPFLISHVKESVHSLAKTKKEEWERWGKKERMTRCVAVMSCPGTCWLFLVQNLNWVMPKPIYCYAQCSMHKLTDSTIAGNLYETVTYCKIATH